MPTILSHTYYSNHGTRFDLDINDRDASGSAAPFSCYGGQGAKVSLIGDSKNVFNRVYSTSCSFSIIVDGSIAIDDFIDALINTTDEKRFTVKMQRNSIIHFVGFIQVNALTLNDGYKPALKIQAIDGIGLLQGFKYLRTIPESGVKTAYIGYDTLHKHICNAFEKLFNLMPDALYPAGHKILTVAHDWKEERQNSSGNPLENLRTHHSTFYKGGVSVPRTQTEFLDLDIMSCYEVLREIARAFNARIYYSNGQYHYEQLNHRIDNEVLRYSYDKGGNYIGDDNLFRNININQVHYVNRTGGLFKFLPPIKKTLVRYASGQRVNIAESFDATHNDDSEKFLQEVDIGEETYIEASIRIDHISLVEVPEVVVPHRQVFDVSIRLEYESESKYISRRVSLVTNSFVNYSPPTIKTAAEGIRIISDIQSGIVFNEVGAEANYYFTIANIKTPLLPTGDDVKIYMRTRFVRFEFYSSYQSTVPTNYESLWRANKFNLRLVNPLVIGTESEEDYQTYEVLANENNSEIIDEEILMGDAPGELNFRKLQYKNGTEWVDTETWSGNNVTAGRELGGILAEDMAKIRGKALARLNHKFIMPTKPFFDSKYIDPDVRIGYSGATYLMMSGTYYSGIDQVEGIFFEINNNGPTLTINNTATKQIVLSGESIPFGSGPQRIPDTGTGGNIIEPPDLLSFSAFEIQKNPTTKITEIPVDPEYYYAYKEGDVIQLTSQITGNTYESIVLEDLQPDDDTLKILGFDLTDEDLPTGTPIQVDSSGSTKVYEEHEGVTTDFIVASAALPDPSIFSIEFIKKSVAVYLRGVRCNYVEPSALAKFNQFSLEVNQASEPPVNKILFPEPLENDDHVTLEYTSIENE